MYPSLWIHSPPEGLLDCLQVQAVPSEGAVNVCLRVGFCADIHLQLVWVIDAYQGAGLLCHTVRVCLAWRGHHPYVWPWGGGGRTGAERRAVHGRNEVMKEGEFKDAGKEDLRVGGRP